MTRKKGASPMFASVIHDRLGFLYIHGPSEPFPLRGYFPFSTNLLSRPFLIFVSGLLQQRLRFGAVRAVEVGDLKQTRN